MRLCLCGTFIDVLFVVSQKDAASQFINGSRPELADSELREAAFLANLLPAAMSENEIDGILAQIAEENNIGPGSDPKRSTGLILKAFYAKVDKSAVDGQVVKQRVDALTDRCRT